MKIFRLFVAFTLVCFALAPAVQAVVPVPDGSYPNFTTAEGQNALESLTGGAANTAVGAFSLFSTTTASFNTAVGAGALDLNTGDQNTAVGVAALLVNTGRNNTAVGVDALGLNTSGESNAAVGAFALYNNTTGGSNTALGFDALFLNTSDENTATGTEALLLNTTGAANTANGAFALANCTGHHNTALGADAGSILTTGNNNIYIGDSGAATDTNTIAIGNLPPAGFADYTLCFIGNAATLTFMQGGAAFGGTVNMSGLTANEGLTDEVRIDASGRLWIGFASSARFKKDIHPMGNTSEAIYSLKPVTFRYKADTTNTLLFGLVAEDVMKVSAALTTLDKEGKPITVHYDQINAMLLNEFLKEHKAFVEEQRKVQELEANAVQQQRKFAQQQKQIEALTAGLQKVSAQLEVNKPGPQTAENSQ